MNKVTSGILAIGIYLALLFLILLYYNVHKIKSKNYVEKNANRVTVTLVNSDKTVFNKSSKITIPKKPTPRQHHTKKIKHHTVAPVVPKKQRVKRIVPSKKEINRKKIEEAKRVARAKARREKEKKERERLARIKREKEKKERERLARIKREKEKKERERLARIKREKEKKERERLARIKREKEKKERERLARIKREKEKKERERLARIKREKEKKERERLARIKREKEKKERERLARIKREKEKKERERLARIKREEERRRRIKERSKNLFSSVRTHNSPRKEPRIVHSSESRVRHTSRVVDRIRDTHQSGRVSNRNRERGVVNAYIAKVERQLNNWNAQSNYKGQSATIKLTIMSSGHFRYRVRHSSSGELTRGLKRFLDQLNRIGLGQHHKSTPYIIEVTFRAK